MRLFTGVVMIVPLLHNSGINFELTDGRMYVKNDDYKGYLGGIRRMYEKKSIY